MIEPRQISRRYALARPEIVSLATGTPLALLTFAIFSTGVAFEYIVAIWAVTVVMHVLWWRSASACLRGNNGYRNLLSGLLAVVLAVTVFAAVYFRTWLEALAMLACVLGIVEALLTTLDLSKAEREKLGHANFLQNLLSMVYLVFGVWRLRPKLMSLIELDGESSSAPDHEG